MWLGRYLIARREIRGEVAPWPYAVCQANGSGASNREVMLRDKGVYTDSRPPMTAGADTPDLPGRPALCYHEAIGT